MDYNPIGKNLLKGLVGLVFVGASMSLEGCNSSNRSSGRRQQDALELSFLGGLLGARGAQVGNRQAVYVGQALANHGANMASASSNDVTVNYNSVNVANSQETRPIWVNVDSYNYCRDFNQNGKIDYPEEVVGLNSSTFIEGDEMYLTFEANRQIQDMRYVLVNGNGMTVERFNNGVDINEPGRCQIHVWYNPTQAEIENLKIKGFDKRYPEKYLGILKPGNYKGLFYSGNQLLISKDFTIIPKK